MFGGRGRGGGGGGGGGGRGSGQARPRSAVCGCALSSVCFVSLSVSFRSILVTMSIDKL